MIFIIIFIIITLLIIFYKTQIKEKFIGAEEQNILEETINKLEILPKTGIFHVKAETKLKIPKYYYRKCNDFYLDEYANNFKNVVSIYNNSPYDSA